eukprot:m51a1_g14439 hypothetical protein, erroneous fusion (1084) ;mRNA; f:555747-560437
MPQIFVSLETGRINRVLKLKGGPSRKTPQRVCILGGGFAGSCLARLLEPSLDVTLVDPNDFFENTAAALSVLEDADPASLQTPHQLFLSRTTLVRGSAVCATPTHVVVRLHRSVREPGDSGVAIPYDWLVVCTGFSRCIRSRSASDAAPPPPLTSWLHKQSSELRSAESIIIVGAGVTGVELAALISAKYRKAKLTIVEADPRGVLPASCADARQYASNALARRGVSVLPGERVVSTEFTEGRYTVATDTGTRISADKLYICTGGTPNTAFMREHFSDCLDAYGRIRVNEYLQVERRRNVFAAGDAVATGEERTAARAVAHAHVVEANILSAIAGKPLAAAHDPADQLPSVVLSFGPEDAIAFDSRGIGCSGLKAMDARRRSVAACSAFLPRKGLLLPPLKHRMHTSHARRDRSPTRPSSGATGAAPSLSPPPSSSGSGSVSGAASSASAGAGMRVAVLRPDSTELAPLVASALMRAGASVAFATVGEPHVHGRNLRCASDTFHIVSAATVDALDAVLAGFTHAVLPLWPRGYTDAGEYAADMGKMLAAVDRSGLQQLVLLAPVYDRETPVGDALRRIVSRAEMLRVQWVALDYHPEYANELLKAALEPLLLFHCLTLPLDDEGATRVLWADTDDIVRCAVALVGRRDMFDGSHFVVTGPESLCSEAIATSLNQLLDDEASYLAASPGDTRDRLVQLGLSPLEADILADSCVPSEAAPTCTVRSLCGAAPTSFAQWLVANRGAVQSAFKIPIDLDALLGDPQALRDTLDTALQQHLPVHREVPLDAVELREELGRGANGIVHKAVYKGATVVVKSLLCCLTQDERELFEKEVAITSLLRHPNIVTCIGACTQGPTKAIILEYADQGSLSKFLARSVVPPTLQLRFALDIARAIAFLHRTGFIHGDVKPDNVLVTFSFRAKLTDFGSLCSLSKDTKIVEGTPEYIAPEAWMKHEMSEKCDVYSFGITMWQIVTRRLPFGELHSIFDLHSKIENGFRPEPLSEESPLKEVVESCWDANPSQRPTAAEVYDELNRISQLRSGTSSSVSSLSSSGDADLILGVRGPQLLPPRGFYRVLKKKQSEFFR